MTNAGNSVSPHHRLCWLSTISDVDMEPATMNTLTSDNPIASSYEMTCAVDRTPPSSGYVEPDAQPASTRPYTPMLVTARMYRTATGMSVNCNGVMRSVN